MVEWFNGLGNAFMGWFIWIRSVLSGFVDSIEASVHPMINGIHPFIRFMSNINIYIVVAVFVLLVLFMFFVRGHRILDKLQNSRNYFAVLLMFGIYMFFAQAEAINLGGGYTLQLQSIVLPMVAKLLGPILGGVISMILYMASFWLNKVPLSANMIFISGISGMLYGWILYQHPTSFLRCLWAKLIVTVTCNILLYPLMQGVLADPEYTEIAVDNIAFSITQNIIMIPVHAVFIYIELIIMRQIRIYLSESSWTLKN